MTTRQTYTSLAALTLLGGGIGILGYAAFSRRSLADEFADLWKAIPEAGAVTVEGNYKDLAYKGNPLDPALYKANPKKVTISPNQASTFAIAIHNAASFFDDNEKAIGTVFKQLQTKEDASRLADAFLGRYKQDLYLFLNETLNSEEMEEYVNKNIKYLK